MKKEIEKFDKDYPQYPTFYGAVVASAEWKEWEKVAHKKGFDWHESTECGWLSPKHFDAFLKFTIKNHKE